MDKFDATLEFEEAIEEIKILTKYSKRNSKNIKKYGLFNKSAIVLLCTKFETFIESFLEEYAFKHSQISDGKMVDSSLFEHITESLINTISSLKKPEDRNFQIDLLVKLWSDDTCDMSAYRVDAKFSYGKHGQKQVEKLLTRFGLIGYLDTFESRQFFREFNSLNNIRNNIIHQDATPSLTHQMVETNTDSFLEFAEKLDTYANCKLGQFIATID